MTFEDCCKAIVAAGKDPKQVKSVNYAVEYARHGLILCGHGFAEDTDEVRVQALYIVGNISQWRADVAKEVRTNLKRIGGLK